MRLRSYLAALCLLLCAGVADAQVKASDTLMCGKASVQNKIDFTLFLVTLIIPADAPAARGQVAQAAHAAEGKKSLPLERVARLVERLEAAEAGRGTSLTQEEPKKELEQATTEMKAFLDAHPDNVDAIILSVRLARFQEVEDVVVADGKNFDEQFVRDLKVWRARAKELASRLDRALALQPNRADAYYWKARIYNASRSGVGEIDPSSIALLLQEAIRNTRRAVELAPDNAAYREALALCLIMDGKDDDAAEAMRSVTGGRHILSLLLADRKAVPIPEGAILDADESASLAAMSMAEGPVHDYPMLRAQVYILRAPASEVVAVYRKRWPDFQFFENHEEKSEEEETHVFGQVLRGPSGALRPAASKREVPKYEEGIVTQGVTLMLMEVRRKTPSDLRGVPVGKVFCILSLFNGRTVPER
jgi:tetratricopeptide (TPR) repeat protein